MFSAVLENTRHPTVHIENLPEFTCYVRHDRYEGDAYALSLNAWILRILAGRSSEGTNHPIYTLEEMEVAFEKWLEENDLLASSRGIVAAGKNFASFDYQFLSPQMKEHFHYRSIDPGSMFIDWKEEKPLSLGKLKSRLDLDEEVAHDALEDARDVIRVIRAGTENYTKGLLKEKVDEG
jgi:hypothetical protein